MNILVVEDEMMLREGLVDLLEGAGHEVTAVADGVSAVDAGTNGTFELVLLDWMLPKLDGVEVCRRLRMARPTLPILMLTAKGSEADKVVGLKTGADDYVTKPFGVKELLARVEAFERRAARQPSGAEVVDLDGCVLDLGRCRGTRGDHGFELTAREVGILRWLHRHRARTVSRGELLQHVWGLSPEMETRTVDVTIGNLRKKIERDPASPAIIVSVKGVGYAWGGA